MVNKGPLGKTCGLGSDTEKEEGTSLGSDVIEKPASVKRTVSRKHTDLPPPMSGCPRTLMLRDTLRSGRGNFPKSWFSHI